MKAPMMYGAVTFMTNEGHRLKLSIRNSVSPLNAKASIMNKPIGVMPKSMYNALLTLMLGLTWK